MKMENYADCKYHQLLQHINKLLETQHDVFLILFSARTKPSTPYKPDWDDPWTMLHKDGSLAYLILKPSDDMYGGLYEWTDDIDEGQQSAMDFFPNAEGIDVVDNLLYFVSKKLKRVFRLDLDSNTFFYQSTEEGLFNGQPDQIVFIKQNYNETYTTTSNDTSDSIMPTTEEPMVYFTEDGGKVAGIHAKDNNGQLYTILESYEYKDEVTGLAFSPDYQYMYVAYQKNGLVFSISRLDGEPFYGASINVKHH
jgi:hypothetical protein